MAVLTIEQLCRYCRQPSGGVLGPGYVLGVGSVQDLSSSMPKPASSEKNTANWGMRAVCGSPSTQHRSMSVEEGSDPHSIPNRRLNGDLGGFTVARGSVSLVKTTCCLLRWLMAGGAQGPLRVMKSTSCAQRHPAGDSCRGPRQLTNGSSTSDCCDNCHRLRLFPVPISQESQGHARSNGS